MKSEAQIQERGRMRRGTARQVRRRSGGTPGVVAAGLLLAACAGQRATFEPAASSDKPRQGGVWAYYDLQVGDQILGDAKVWSEGIIPDALEDKRPAIHVGLRIRNGDEAPMRVDAARFEIELSERGGELRVLEDVAKTLGDVAVQPETIGRVQFWVAIPKTVRVRDIRAFEANWAVETGRGSLVRSTPFLREVDGRDRAFYVIDPWPYWGWRRRPGHPWWWY